MSDKPPIISGPPPIISRATPPPLPKKKHFSKVVIFVVVGFIGFMAFRAIQFLQYTREHPRQLSPGEKAFREANRQIISNIGAQAFGNSKEAVALAQDYSKALKILRAGFFTKGKDDAFSISKGEFLTYCQLNKDSCVFLVHVPELRRFTSDAKQSLAELAWINAQSVLKTKLAQPPATVVVGVKGALLYDSILIGDFVADPAKEGDGIKTRSSGIEDSKLLYPFFALEEQPSEKP